MRAPRRGYVMLEAMIGGALLAVALSSAMSFVGFYRRETSLAARKAEASAIASAVADELVARDFGTGEGAEAPYPGHPGLTYSWTITQSGLHDDSVPALTNADQLHLISVTVTYQTSGEPTQLIYERLKRNPL